MPTGVNFVFVLFLCGQAWAAQKCGQKILQTRVVGGENALAHSWPWQISLRVGGRHICGGSLIKVDWVVTAAHCVDRDTSPGRYKVVVGAHTLTGSTSVQQTFSVKKVIKHGGFHMGHLNNDIALLQLSSAVSLNSKVNAVCLPEAGTEIQTGASCYIVGWGRTRGGGQVAHTLQQAMLPIAAHHDCARVNGKLLPVHRSTMLCAGGEGKAGGCQGDSGGQFVCYEKSKWVLRGAVSWGHRDCRTDHYTVFARISSFIRWINNKISTAGSSGGSSSGPASTCVDKNKYCRHWKGYCSYHTYVQNNCAKTCHKC